MTLYDIIRSLENAKSAIETSLTEVRALIGSVPPLTERLNLKGFGPSDIHEVAADIIKTARKHKMSGRKKMIRKRVQRLRKKIAYRPGNKTFREYVVEVLTEAGQELNAAELEKALRAKGWTTSSRNVPGLLSVMMPSVKEVKKTAPRVWTLRK